MLDQNPDYQFEQHEDEANNLVVQLASQFATLKQTYEFLANRLAAMESGSDFYLAWPAVSEIDRQAVGAFNTLSLQGVNPHLAFALAILWLYRDALPTELQPQKRDDIFVPVDFVDSETGEISQRVIFNPWFAQESVQEFAAEAMLRGGKRKPKIPGATLIKNGLVAATLATIDDQQKIFLRSKAGQTGEGVFRLLLISQDPNLPEVSIQTHYAKLFIRIFNLLGKGNDFRITQQLFVDYFDTFAQAVLSHGEHIRDLSIRVSSEHVEGEVLPTLVAMSNINYLYIESFLHSHADEESVSYEESEFDVIKYVTANCLLDSVHNEQGKLRSSLEIFGSNAISRLIIKQYVGYLVGLDALKHKLELTGQQEWEFSSYIVDGWSDELLEQIVALCSEVPLVVAMHRLANIDLQAASDEYIRFISPEN